MTKLETKTNRKIKKENYTYFAACICDNMLNKQIAKEFNISNKTVITYKSYAKAVVSGNKELGRKIYKNLNKGIIAKIDEGIAMGRGTKLKYTFTSKTGPEQIGPRLRVNEIDYLMKPTINVVPEPKLDLNAGAINALPTPKQPEPAKKDVPVKEIVRLLQSTLESIQTLLEKL